MANRRIIDEERVLDYKETWKGEYRDIAYSVIHWELGWNYYLHIPVDQLPDAVKPVFNLRSRTYKISDDSNEHTSYNYPSAPIISDLDWHGGITFYEKVRDDRGKVIGYTLGCDYLHLWDEDRVYSVDYVAREARFSIDKLWEYIPNLKLRCGWDGKFYNADEVYYTDRGVCVALENKSKWEDVRITDKEAKEE